VHGAIGTIYAGLGKLGEDQIGGVFNSRAARDLHGKSVYGLASKEMARMEWEYWADVWEKNPERIGGWMGAAVPPTVRDWTQQGFARAASVTGYGSDGSDGSETQNDGNGGYGGSYGPGDSTWSDREGSSDTSECAGENAPPRGRRVRRCRPRGAG
jgi:hypothetical protein